VQKCVACDNDSVIINCNNQAMCCDCFIKFQQEQENGQRISRQGNDE
jgi:hypothetical protein